LVVIDKVVVTAVVGFVDFLLFCVWLLWLFGVNVYDIIIVGDIVNILIICYCLIIIIIVDIHNSFCGLSLISFWINKIIIIVSVIFIILILMK
jgi:hypothetical protein